MSSVLAEYGVDRIAMGILSFGHLVGIVLGLGTILYLDGGCFLSITRNSWDGFRTFMSGALFDIATKYVMVGLGILWITGCGFIVHYGIFDPDKLANPKLIAKFAFVSMLTINGYFLHYLVLRRVARMRDCSQLLRTEIGPLCLFCGAVSSASWIGAFLLGALPVLNNSVAFPTFIAAWAVLIVVVYFCTKLAIGWSARRGRNGDAASDGPVGSHVPESMDAMGSSARVSQPGGYGQATAVMAAAFTVDANRENQGNPA